MAEAKLTFCIVDNVQTTLRALIINKYEMSVIAVKTDAG